MPTRSLALLLVAAAAVALLHSILPDHWVPLAVVARTQRWTLRRVARVSGLAAAGHVLTSLALAGVVAIIGLQFRNQIDIQQGHIVGGLLVLTGVGFLIWGLTGHGHEHEHEHREHSTPEASDRQRGAAQRLAAIAVPFGVAASPDLTILPVALAASAVGGQLVVGVLLIFAAVTLTTFIGLTVLATAAGYQIKGEWLEEHATAITALVLIVIGIAAYVGL